MATSPIPHVTNAATLPAWKDTMLAIWAHHSSRTPSAADVACLSLLLDTPASIISERLRNLAGGPPAPALTVLPIAPLCQNPSLVDLTSSEATHDLRSPPMEGCSSNRMVHLGSSSAHDVPLTDVTSISTLASKSLPFRLRSAEGAPLEAPQDSGPPFSSTASELPSTQWESYGASVPHDILSLIEKDIDNRRRKRCRPFTQTPNTNLKSKGSFLCTLGCGRSLASACDRRRHEENIYPREYWACYQCSPEATDRRQIFHRLDKIQKHSKDHHSSQLDVDRCKIHNPPVLTPTSCALCGHLFSDRDEREQHIDERHAGQKGTLVDDTSTHEVADTRCAHSSTATLQPNSTRVAESGPETLSQHPVLPHSKVILQRLAASSTRTSQVPTLHTIAVQWRDKANEKSGVATLLEADVAFDMQLGRACEPRTYIVKQYSQEHLSLCQQELRACEEMSTWDNNGGLPKCFGAFQDIDKDGNPTYNILLESSHGNLWDYWMRTAPPKTFRQIQAFYSELFKLATGLDSLQRLREMQRSGLDCVLRGDIRPESIRTTPNSCPQLSDTFKLNMYHQSCTFIRNDNHTGRRVFVVLVWVGRSSKLDLICATASKESNYDPTENRTNGLHPDPNSMLERVRRAEILSFSCVLSLAATWMTMGRSGLRTLERHPLSQLQDWQDSQRPSTSTPSKCAVAAPKVSEWHRQLKKSIHSEDKVTAKLLNLLDQTLSQPQTAHRIRARDLKAQFEKILRQAEFEWEVLGQINRNKESDMDTDTEPDFRPNVRRTESFAAEMSDVDPGFWDAGVRA